MHAEHEYWRGCDDRRVEMLERLMRHGVRVIRSERLC